MRSLSRRPVDPINLTPEHTRVKIIIIGPTSMVAKRIRHQLDKFGIVSLAGRNSEADFHCDLSSSYIADCRLARADVIIHCAASFEGNDSEGALKNELVNSVGAFHVAQLANDSQCAHLIYVSSIFSYEHPQNEYFGSYGLSKRHGQENLEWACRRAGIQFTALLASQIYDEYGEARKHQPLFYRIMDAAKQGADVTLFGQVDPQRNFLFVEDLAEVVTRVVLRRVTGVHPVVCSASHRLTEIAHTAFKVFGRGGSVIFLKNKPNIPSVFVPPQGDLYDRIQYSPQTDLAAGIMLIKEHLR